jgi:hypothetical protein
VQVAFHPRSDTTRVLDSAYGCALNPPSRNPCRRYQLLQVLRNVGVSLPIHPAFERRRPYMKVQDSRSRPFAPKSKGTLSDLYAARVPLNHGISRAASTVEDERTRYAHLQSALLFLSADRSLEELSEDRVHPHSVTRSARRARVTECRRNPW